MKALTCQILAIFLCLFIFVSCGDGDSSSTENPNSNVMMDESDNGNDTMMDGDDAQMMLDDLEDMLEPVANSEVDDNPFFINEGSVAADAEALLTIWLIGYEAWQEGLTAADILSLWITGRAKQELKYKSSSRNHSPTISRCPAPNFNTNQPSTENIFIDDTFNNNGQLLPGSWVCATRAVYISEIADLYTNDDPNTVVSICDNSYFLVGFGGINNSATNSETLIIWLDSNRNSNIESDELYNIPENSGNEQNLENNGQRLLISFFGTNLINAGCYDPVTETIN